MNISNTILIKNAKIFQYDEDKIITSDLYIENGKITLIDKNITLQANSVYDMNNKIVLPGLVDVHVHLREPGFEYKETVHTGTMSAAAGGFTTIMCMPNTKPLIDSIDNLNKINKIIEKDAVVNTLPYACITNQNKDNESLVDIDLLSKYVIAFSNDGVSVMNDTLMEKAMLLIKRNNKILVEHVEDKTLTNNGVIGTHKLANKYGLAYLDSKSEYVQLERDLLLAQKTQCEYHACHLSCKESVDLISKYKKNNKNISCEVTPHHLLLNDQMVCNNANWKMNPPIRSIGDQEALIKGIIDGTISIIATDHAPHSQSEKEQPFNIAPFGIVGLETAFCLLYTNLVLTKKITLKKLIELMSINPSKRFNLNINQIKVGAIANFFIADLENEKIIDSSAFVSKGKNTPFNGWKCYGWPILTICKGKVVYESKK